jgi:hypothetical protein
MSEKIYIWTEYDNQDAYRTGHNEESIREYSNEYFETFIYFYADAEGNPL